jgi:predicted dehydrogenase
MTDKNITCAADLSDLRQVPAPNLSYQPVEPRAYAPNIGLIGCGDISPFHLAAYREAGYNISALCDRNPDKVNAKRDEHFPEAATFDDYHALLQDESIEVVDITTHPEHRGPIIEAALDSGKHVLSQKPFVLDLDEGERLADLADAKGLRLAVNQNGRWAPHFSYIRQAVEAGLLGDVFAVHLAVHWDHSWTADSAFDEIPHLILYDFGIHWFDIATCFLGDRTATEVFASVGNTPGQPNKAPLLGQTQIAYEDAQASLSFDAYTRFGAQDTTFVTGTNGTAASQGPDLQHQAVTLYTDDTYSTPELTGDWFTSGFHGAMAELLCAIEENREPLHSARNNLRSLALCFAALRSANTGQPVEPGTVRKAP